VRSHAGAPRIGWIGSPATVHYLSSIASALQALSRHVDFELHVIGARLEIPGVRTTSFEWTLESERDRLAEIDVGVMPLDDSPWSRSKCAYKLLQYAAMGIPCVASAVGENKHVVDHAITGFLVSDAKGWIDSLAALCGDSFLRSEMGRAARKHTETRFSHRAVAPMIQELLGELVG
jgi:glycosyltransferase involved in cell wall biosynthesis